MGEALPNCKVGETPEQSLSKAATAGIDVGYIYERSTDAETGIALSSRSGEEVHCAK